MKTYITVNTKSNYNNLNGKELEVKEFLGNLVAVNFEGQTIDFSLREITSIKSK